MPTRKALHLTTAVALALAATACSTNTNSESATDQAAASAAVSESASPGDASTCGLEAGDQKVPDGVLKTSAITVGDGLTVPTIDGVGPGITDGISRCFAHSPTGSVLAATNFMTWFSSQQQIDTVAGLLIEPGSDRDRMLESINTTWDGSTVAPFNIAGYKLAVRSDDEVLVTLAVTLPDNATAMTSWPLVMVWQDGDWLVRLNSNETWGEQVITDFQAEGFSGMTL